MPTFIKSELNIAVPLELKSISTSLECGALIEAETPTLSCSAIWDLSAERVVIVGKSSLIMFNVISFESDVALTILPMLNTTVSLISTSLSSKSFVDIVIDADFEFAGITILSALTVNSESIVAVPDIVNGIVISLPEISDKLATSDTSWEEFSNISLLLKLTTTFSGSSSSLIVKVYVSFNDELTFTKFSGSKMIVSFSSSILSSIGFIVRLPEVSPILIKISGATWTFCILWPL